jgi:transcriptional regulator with XRE-family HTH domain
MGRPEKTISARGPMADFAQQLRLLRQHAALTLRQLAAKTGLSTATLSVAASGRQLPTWDVARAYVQACGGDAEDWQVRWERAAWLSRLPLAARLPGKASHAPCVQRRENGLGFPGGPVPLPVTAETSSEFMECLLRVKIWAGDPPVRALSRRAGLPSSTMQDFLRRERRKLPPVATVRAFLEACGVDDPNVIAEWVFTWRRLKFAETGKRRKTRQHALVSALPASQFWPESRGARPHVRRFDDSASASCAENPFLHQCEIAEQ